MKTIPITLRLPAFILSPWAWGPLVLVLGFLVGVRVIPQRVVAQEAKRAPVAQPAAAPGPAWSSPRITFDGIELPCGHPVSGAILGGDSTSYRCDHGHEFIPYGSWYVPSGR